jgi:hypothetical protein
VILNVPLTTLYVQALDGNAGALGIGTAHDVSLSTGLHMIAKIIPVAANAPPGDFSSANVYGASPQSTAEFWIVGTAADSYLPSFLAT